MPTQSHEARTDCDRLFVEVTLPEESMFPGRESPDEAASGFLYPDGMYSGSLTRAETPTATLLTWRERVASGRAYRFM